MLKYGKGKNKYFLIGILIYFFFAVVNVVIPILQAQELVAITDNLYKKFMIYVIIVSGVIIISNILDIIFYMSMRYWAKYCARNLKYDLLQKVSLIKNSTLNKTSTGSIIQRVTNDCNDAFNNLWDIANQVKDIVTVVSALITVICIKFTIGLMFIAVTLVILSIKYYRLKYRHKQSKINREKSEKAISSISEYVRGIRDIKLLGNNNRFLEYTSRSIRDYDESQTRMQNKLTILDSISNIIFNLFIVLFCYVSVIYIKNASLTVAGFIVIYSYRFRIVYGFDSLTRIGDFIVSFNLNTERVMNILEGDSYPKETFGSKKVKKLSGKFEFKNVTFHYDDDKPIIKDMNFTINAKTTVGIVGKSGSGKTTIFHLLAKLFEVDKGEILLDDINVNELDKSSIRGNITMINQTPYIFNLSIMDNLKFANSKATEEEIKKACKMACLDEFIESLPDKYNTIVGENGITLSGGEKQRLAIARALVQNTEIIFFDEATSALDNETQNKIQKAIDNMKRKYTILIIAHRFSTVLNCDKILYLEKGVIKGEGTHEELLKTCLGYKKLYELELKKSNE